MKTERFSKIPKNNKLFTCLLLFRILVNLPNFEILWHLNKLDLCGLFKTEWKPDLHDYSVIKSPHNSNSFRHESISKLPDLIWWPQTKDKNIHRLTPWQLWNALTPKQIGLGRTFFNWMTTWPRPLFIF